MSKFSSLSMVNCVSIHISPLMYSAIYYRAIAWFSALLSPVWSRMRLFRASLLLVKFINCCKNWWNHWFPPTWNCGGCDTASGLDLDLWLGRLHWSSSWIMLRQQQTSISVTPMRIMFSGGGCLEIIINICRTILLTKYGRLDFVSSCIFTPILSAAK